MHEVKVWYETAEGTQKATKRSRLSSGRREKKQGNREKMALTHRMFPNRKVMKLVSSNGGRHTMSLSNRRIESHHDST